MGDREQEAMHALLTLLSDTDHWIARIGRVADIGVQPASPMAGDDKHAGMFQMSGTAWTHLSIAVDHLATLRAATVGCKDHTPLTLNLQISGQFTLLRAMIENSSAVLWLLGPSSRNERIMRRLQLATGDIRNNEALRVVMQSPGPSTKEQRLEKVRSVAAARGLDSKTATKSPGYEEKVYEAGAATEIGSKLAVVLWRGCSGLAHGDQWAAISLPHSERLASTTPGVTAARLSPNVEGLYLGTLAAKALMSQAFALYHQRCQAPTLTGLGLAERSGKPINDQT